MNLSELTLEKMTRLPGCESLCVDDIDDSHDDDHMVLIDTPRYLSPFIETDFAIVPSTELCVMTHNPDLIATICNAIMKGVAEQIRIARDKCGGDVVYCENWPLKICNSPPSMNPKAYRIDQRGYVIRASDLQKELDRIKAIPSDLR